MTLIGIKWNRAALVLFFLYHLYVKRESHLLKTFGSISNFQLLISAVGKKTFIHMIFLKYVICAKCI